MIALCELHAYLLLVLLAILLHIFHIRRFLNGGAQGRTTFAAGPWDKIMNGGLRSGST